MAVAAAASLHEGIRVGTTKLMTSDSTLLFIGDDPSHHQSNLRTYEHVSLGEVFPGVSVKLRATGTNVEKIFTVEPGIDPDRIKMAIDDAEALRVGAGGELAVRTAGGEIAF